MKKIVIAGGLLVALTSLVAAQAWLLSGAGQVFKASGPPPVNNCAAVVGQMDFSNPDGCNIIWMR